MWIVTRVVNACDQEGDYFYAAFDHKPNVEELSILMYNKKLSEITIVQRVFIDYLKNGGGIRSCSDEWYHLSELNSGEKYISKG